ncbi:UDP-N-acetylglucosamine--N-acetylmuramyl- (pentapeptide) pyrophosphoryl-undecaprenol N-acetylglucosamine transferase [Gossypium arboreum]|uniref:UDP-N-acetylglucosamine--N-acetylmuramyl-(Pentapeptide) pyrophosphoryl-undecaprenol N-acetylglucosamine transferase n=1 Tax=Gossypium arboreum TaxID=29729 RepID=A0A0B0MYY8_GOSAR|nr:UDP-N-acetylglucosamine--N-acetylmuramyl- (pentapeptide) pyrophosphoryl-undecaprenol N-acetylglucosamine transferase [Gossypium arboreum]
MVIAWANKILIPGIAVRDGIDANKLAVPEASLVCLSFRANSQIVHCFKIVIRGITATPWQWRG